MRFPFFRVLPGITAFGCVLALLAGCNGATPPGAPGQGDALPAMQPGPTSVGPAGMGPAGSNSNVGSGNLANPGMAGPGVGPAMP